MLTSSPDSIDSTGGSLRSMRPSLTVRSLALSQWWRHPGSLYQLRSGVVVSCSQPLSVTRIMSSGQAVPMWLGTIIGSR